MIDLKRNMQMDFVISNTRWETTVLISEAEIAADSPDSLFDDIT